MPERHRRRVLRKGSPLRMAVTPRTPIPHSQTARPNGAGPAWRPMPRANVGLPSMHPGAACRALFRRLALPREGRAPVRCAPNAASWNILDRYAYH
jgi:hypothetical protein